MTSARRSAWVVSALALATAACHGSSDTGSGGTGGTVGTGGAGGTTHSGGHASGGHGGAGGGSGASGGGGSGAVSAAALLALTNGCNKVNNGSYASDDGGPATIDICGLTGAVFWHADMDIDCDGKTTAQCNSNTDPAYQNQTSATDSNGDPLDAASLPFAVVPLQSARFAYDTAGLALGSVVAIIYQGQVLYTVFGDEGPDNIIGEASYASAQALGIDPDPATGGVDSGVTYIAFTGASAVVGTIEDHAEATSVGVARATALLQNN